MRYFVALLLVSASMHAVVAAPVVDLATVRGMEHYEGAESGRQLLEENGFVVVPRYHHRIFGPYLEKELPPFITSDSVHRTFHVIFEEALRDLELAAHGEFLELTQGLLAAVEKGPNESEVARLARDYLLVAHLLLDEGDAPEDRPEVAGELSCIHGAAGIAVSPLFGYRIDYSQFKPRGFYTESPELRSLFRALTWFGCAAFRLESDRETHAAMVISDCFRASTELREAWRTLDKRYAALLGPCDDLTVEEYAAALRELDAVPEDSRLAAFRKAAESMRDPRYNDMVLTPDKVAEFVAETKGMRFMGRRYLPDGGVLATVTHPRVPGRFRPTGLDVLAANGSARARAHRKGESEAYAAALDEAGTALEDDLSKNPNTHYAHVLHVMRTLTDKTHPEAPAFMQTAAYEDKNLMTAGAVWASTRHAFILHAKQNMTTQGGSYKEPLVGFIEANSAFFDAMTALNRATLRVFEAVDGPSGKRFARFGAFVVKLQGLLEKQLGGMSFDDHEKRFFATYGEELARLQGHLTNAPRDAGFPWMALVADVFTESLRSECLEVATGGAMPIYAIVEQDGARHLVRGAVYSYFEIWQPIAERLTDARWRRRWDAGSIPPLPSWTASFVAGAGDVNLLSDRLLAGEEVPEAAFLDDPELKAFLIEVVRGERPIEDLEIWRQLASLAVRKYPDEVVPLLLDRLRRTPVPGRDMDSVYYDAMKAGEAVAPEERPAAELVLIRFALGHALRPQDLDTLWEIATQGDANTAYYVVYCSMWLRDKAVEQFRLRVIDGPIDAKTKQLAMNLMKGGVSRDVTPTLLKLWKEGGDIRRGEAADALAEIWAPRHEGSALAPIPETASRKELDAWRLALREVVTCHTGEVDTTGMSWKRIDRIEDRFEAMLRLAFAVDHPAVEDLALRLFQREAVRFVQVVTATRHGPIDDALRTLAALVPYADCDDKGYIIFSLQRRGDAAAISLLRTFLEDESAEDSDEPRVCDYAYYAVRTILDGEVSPPDLESAFSSIEALRSYVEPHRGDMIRLLDERAASGDQE